MNSFRKAEMRMKQSNTKKRTMNPFYAYKIRSKNPNTKIWQKMNRNLHTFSLETERRHEKQKLLY